MDFQPQLYIDSQQVTASSLGASSTSRENEFDQAVDEWMKRDTNDFSQNISAAQRAAKRRGVASIRSQIARMRAAGKTEYEINKALPGLFKQYHEAESRFGAGNELYAANKTLVSSSNQSTAKKINQCAFNFADIKRESSLEEGDRSTISSLVATVKSTGFKIIETGLELLIPSAQATVSGRCKRPEFATASEEYGKVWSISALPEVVGGALKKNFDQGTFINGCASRISYVLGQTGCKIPKIKGETVSGASGEQYIFRVKTLDKFLRTVFGPPDCEWHNGSSSGVLGSKACSDLIGKKGIFIEHWSLTTLTCTGHAGLFHGIWFGLPPANGVFWELPDNEKHV